jgi:hypothetical protein
MKSIWLRHVWSTGTADEVRSASHSACRPAVSVGKAAGGSKDLQRIVATSTSFAQSTNHQPNMSFSYGLGLEYLVVRKEIPLSEDERIACGRRGHTAKGRWNSRKLRRRPTHPNDRTATPKFKPD